MKLEVAPEWCQSVWFSPTNIIKQALTFKHIDNFKNITKWNSALVKEQEQVNFVVAVLNDLNHTSRRWAYAHMHMFKNYYIKL